jgi:hypothetical protein
VPKETTPQQRSKDVWWLGLNPCHHHNSRRFKCACGKVQEWGEHAFKHPANDAVFCSCGRAHGRGRGHQPNGRPCEGKYRTQKGVS